MATITEMKRENQHMKGLMRDRFKALMKEVDKKYPDLNYIAEKTKKMNTDAYLIILNKKNMIKQKLKKVV